MWTAKTLIRLGGCPVWSVSSLGALSFCWFCHEAAHLLYLFSLKRIITERILFCFLWRPISLERNFMLHVLRSYSFDRLWNEAILEKDSVLLVQISILASIICFLISVKKKLRILETVLKIHDCARSWENVSYAVCEQQKRRSACISMQSDHHFYCSLLR